MQNYFTQIKETKHQEFDFVNNKQKWLDSWGDLLFYENINFNHGKKLLDQYEFGIAAFDQSSLERWNKDCKRLKHLFSFSGQQKHSIRVPDEDDSNIIFPEIITLERLETDNLLFKGANLIPLSCSFAQEVIKLLSEQLQTNAIYRQIFHSKSVTIPVDDALSFDESISNLDDLLPSITTDMDWNWNNLINDSDVIDLFGPHSARFTDCYTPPQTNDQEKVDPEEVIGKGM